MRTSTSETIEGQRWAVAEAREAIREVIGDRIPKVCVILGSGLGAFADVLHERIELSYRDIPGFPVPAVEGHAGKLVSGRCGHTEVIALQGRGHFYEGYSPRQLVLPVRVMHELGASLLIVTNAAGSANPARLPGSLMLIDDHINFTGYNPLTGPNNDEWGVRFPDNAGVYNPELRTKAAAIAGQAGWNLPSGVYMFMTGPSFETPAEIKLARTLGADVVGMSTFPEALAAHHCGMRVAGISYVSNAGAGILPGKLDHTSVLAMPSETKEKLIHLIRELILTDL